MDAKEKALEAFKFWYASLPIHKSSGGPAKGTIAAALVVLERLRTDCQLNLEAHRARGGSQIKGAGGAALKKILNRFGENRPFAKEGGRTNRGGPGDIEKMLDALKGGCLDKSLHPERIEILNVLQGFLVGRVIEFHNRERIKFVYDSSKTTWQTIQELLLAARETGKEGPVAQYLVGAKLKLRFPDLIIGNESYSTADDQLGRPGDFWIGDTAFHATVAPMSALFEKCAQNIKEGYRVFLLVPDRTLSGARQNAELAMPGRIVVESIESFVSTNIEELSVFARKGVVSGLRRLLETYNGRVLECETDKSMLIEIPKNL
jgi:hypothetical protein